VAAIADCAVVEVENALVSEDGVYLRGVPQLIHADESVVE
jgi:hypothetical protein